MRFLRQLFRLWLNSLRSRSKRAGNEYPERSEKSTPEVLAPNEQISRFLYSKSTFSLSNKRVKPGAFSPPPDLSLSAVHSTGVQELNIWSIGRRTLGTQPGRNTIYGRADLPVESLIAQKLQAIRDDNPFERHTSVVGWPQDPDKERQKEDIKAICLEISLDPKVRLVAADPPVRIDAIR